MEHQQKDEMSLTWNRHTGKVQVFINILVFCVLCYMYTCYVFGSILKLTTRSGIPPLLKALWRPLDLLFLQLIMMWYSLLDIHPISFLFYNVLGLSKFYGYTPPPHHFDPQSKFRKDKLLNYL